MGARHRRRRRLALWPVGAGRISHAIGPLVSRNLFGHVPEQKQRSAAQAVIVLFLAVSIVLTLVAPNMLTTLINTSFSA